MIAGLNLDLSELQEEFSYITRRLEEITSAIEIISEHKSLAGTPANALRAVTSMIDHIATAADKAAEKVKASRREG